MFKNLLTCFFCLFSIITGKTQDTIRLKNSSFEGEPQQGDKFHSTQIEDWVDCAPYYHFNGESPPDIHPNGIWGNNLKAQDGKTYLGMVARDNDTYEAISQVLSEPLIAGKCYTLSVYLARAQTYMSLSHITSKPTNYYTPLILKVFGGSVICKQEELLFQSYEVESHIWENHHFEFKPEKNYKYITFVAYYHHTPILPYCGNLLLDGLSDIISIDCN